MLAKNIFVNQNMKEITLLFAKHGGNCSQLTQARIAQCKFTRKWKLKNIGGQFDASNWSDPSARFEFDFVVNETGQVRDLNILIVDVTEYKKVGG